MIDLEINKGTVVRDIELIIFDKDGTLFELFPYWSVVARHRAENICNAMQVRDPQLIDHISRIMGVDRATGSMNPKGPIGIFNRSYIQDLILQDLTVQGYPVDRKIIADAFLETDTFIAQDEILKKALVPVRGLDEFLSGVRRHCRCAIFSYDQTVNLEHIVRLMQIDRYFSFLLGGDKLEKPKPDPWGAVKIMEELHIPAEHTLLIGDSIHDIESGKKAGCSCVITRRSEISDIARVTPLSDFIIDDYTSIRLVR